MSASLLIVPALLVAEAVLLILRYRGVIRWRPWMMTPAWLGLVIFVVEAAALAALVWLGRDVVRWLA